MSIIKQSTLTARKIKKRQNWITEHTDTAISKSANESHRRAHSGHIYSQQINVNTRVIMSDVTKTQRKFSQLSASLKTLCLYLKRLPHKLLPVTLLIIQKKYSDHQQWTVQQIKISCKLQLSNSLQKNYMLHVHKHVNHIQTSIKSTSNTYHSCQSGSQKNKQQPLGAVPLKKWILTRSVANGYFQLYATEVHTTLVREHNELLSLSVTANKETVYFSTAVHHVTSSESRTRTMFLLSSWYYKQQNFRTWLRSTSAKVL